MQTKGNIYIDGNFTSEALATGVTAPSTTGTTKMLIVDANGTFSFTDVPSGTSQWTTSGSDIYYSTGNVRNGTTNTAYGAFNVSRTFTVLDRHSFDDYSLLNPSAGGLGFGTFDASTEMAGSVTNNHFAAYQSRLNHSSTGDLDGTYGMVGVLILNQHSGTGTITNNYGVLIHDVNIPGSGDVTNNYGIKIENINQGATNYAIHSDGGIVRTAGSLHLTGTFNHYLQKDGGFIWTTDGTNSTQTGGIYVSGSGVDIVNIFAGNNISTPQLAINGTTNKITITGALAGLVESIGLQDSNTSIAAQTYVLELYASYAYTIDTLHIISGSGTATAAVKINGTNVTSLSAVAVSSTISNTNSSGANAVAVGDKVTLVISSPSSLDNLQVSLKTTRT